MNDEIKEIIEHIKTYPEKMYCLSEKEKIIMLDYITSLQQDIENYVKITLHDRKEIDNLRKENEELNRMCELYSKSLYNAELTDYKSRCEKANKFIDNNSHYYSTIKHGEGFSIDLDEEVFCNILLNILNGSDDK